MPLSPAVTFSLGVPGLLAGMAERQVEVGHNTLPETYTCVLLDAANNILRSSSDEFLDETAAIRHAAIIVFLNEAAAGYELWRRLRKVAHFKKPGLGRA